MDRSFLEFLRNFLIHSAERQRQMDDISQWIRLGYRGFDDLMELLKKSYGLDGVSEKSPEFHQLWEKTSQDFKESFQECLNLLHVVSRSDYDTLKKENELLKKQVSEQEKVIIKLRAMLGEKVTGLPEDVAKGIQSLMITQMDQYQEIMKSFSRMFSGTSSSEDTGSERKKTEVTRQQRKKK